MTKKLFILILLLAGMSFGQVTVAPFTNPRVQFFNNNLPCAGCLLDTFSAGTSNALVTYSESTGTTLNSNPIVLGSDGSAVVYLTAASYKFRLRTAAGVTLWVQDNITWASPLSTFNGITSTGNAVIQPAVAATAPANQSSPTFSLCGFYFNVSSLNDCWVLSDVLGTGTSPTSTLSFSHSGSGGTVALSFPNVAVSFGNITATGDVALSTGKVIKWNSDTGLSRDAAGAIDVGNGTQGDKSGTINVTSLKLYKSDGTVPATITNDTLGGFTLTANSGVGAGGWSFNTSGNLVFPRGGAPSIQGATSGAVTLAVPAVAGANTLTLPAATGTLARTSGDTFTSTTLTGATTGNTINLFSSGCPPQGPTASINGTGAAVDIFTCPLPVNVVENNKILHVICSGVHDTGVANVAMTMNLNGQNITSGQTGTTGSQSWSMEAYVLRTGTTTGQAWGISPTSTGNNGTMVAFSIGLTGLSWTSGTQTLNCQFTVAAGDHMTGRVWAPMSIQ